MRTVALVRGDMSSVLSCIAVDVYGSCRTCSNQNASQAECKQLKKARHASPPLLGLPQAPKPASVNLSVPYDKGWRASVAATCVLPCRDRRGPKPVQG